MLLGGFCANPYKEIIRIRGEIRAFFVDGVFRDELGYANEAENGARFKSYRLEDKELIVLYTDVGTGAYALDLKRDTKTITKRMPFSINETMHDVSRLYGKVPQDSVIVYEITDY